MCSLLRPFAIGLLVALPLLGTTSSAQISTARRGTQSSGTRFVPEPLTSGHVDIAASRVYIFVGRTGFGHDHGVEGHLKSGTVSLGAAEKAGSLVFDMNSFDADTPAARRYVGLQGTTDASTRRQVNANMKGAAVLNVQRFPVATFTIQSAKRLPEKNRRGNTVYNLAGTFTLHGVTRRIAFNAEAAAVDTRSAAGASTGTRLRGNFVIHQTQFGITPFSKAFGAVGVTDALRIYGDIVLNPATTAPPERSDSLATERPVKGGVRQ